LVRERPMTAIVAGLKKGFRSILTPAIRKILNPNI
jgi:hypothetical protein